MIVVPDPLLVVEGVSKRYCRDPRRWFRYAASDTIGELLGQPTRDELRDGEFWALRDVTLRVDTGEVVGVIGHNGAGKSTLLNLVAGGILPTTGCVTTYAERVCRIDQSGLISPQETGRENILMQLAVHGVPTAAQAEEVDAIARFADLEGHLDTIVGTYSSGMRSRLGFAIYARLQPDLFLVDEALGGGDRRFRERFRDFIDGYVADGGSMLFCLHDAAMIQSLCHRVLVLDQGRPVVTAEPASAIDAYNEIAAARGRAPLAAPHRSRRRGTAPVTTAPEDIPESPLRITSVEVRGEGGGDVVPGGPAEVSVHLTASEAVVDVSCELWIGRGELMPLAALRGPNVDCRPGETILVCRIASLALEAGRFDLLVRFLHHPSDRVLASTAGAAPSTFRIRRPHPHDPREGTRRALVHLPAAWRVDEPTQDSERHLP